MALPVSYMVQEVTMTPSEKVLLGALPESADGALTRNELLDSSGLSPTSFERAIGSLVSRGVVVRFRAERDPRRGGHRPWRYHRAPAPVFDLGVVQEALSSAIGEGEGGGGS